MIVIDASVLVSASVSTDVHYAVSREWLARQISPKVVPVLPYLVAVELGAAVRRRTGNPVLAQRAVETLYTITLI